jgi:hypothetical protein
MEKVEVRKKSFFKEENDDLERETYLKELGESVHRYLKTGVKNKQLDDLVFLEKKFQEKYEQRFDIKSIASKISENSKEIILEIGFAEHIAEKDSSCDASKEMDFSIKKKASDQIINVIDEVVNNNLQKILKDTAYLSHVNMLYEIYEQEERLRREEREFDRRSEKFPKMADVTKKLSERRRMELEELEQQVNMSQKELEDLLNGCSMYFNVRGRKENVQISLSTKGRKYNEYILNSQKIYSNDALNQLVYKNCNSLMESLEISYERGMQYELKLEGLNPDKERVIKHKYHRISQEFIAASEDIYSTRDYILNVKKVSADRSNEKNRFRIPDEWEEDLY